VIYQYAESPLGCLMMAETEAGAGISLLYIGDSEATLMQAAQEAFPDHHWQVTTHLSTSLEQICSALQQKQPQPILPLNVQGTAFQQQVWQALQDIPFGETVSYSQLAEQLGMPTAVRAVASACGANEIALLIPCHRVVRKNGDLSGYRWGITRKRQLLDMEQGLRPSN